MPDALKPNQPNQSTAEESGKDSANWIAEVSHELRLPIANIRLLVETLLDGALEDEEACRRMLKRAFQEVERLQSLVSDLLSVEKVANHSELRCEWNDLGERAKYAVESVATMAMAKGVQVTIDTPKGFKIYANSEQLDQVLLNLVENAVKFTPGGGIVKVVAGEPGCFSVQDSGVGMPEGEITKIFQRFYRIDRTQSKGSTGLGLSIVKSIMELHGGRVHVESAEGSGSTFKLTFPDPR